MNRWIRSSIVVAAALTSACRAVPPAFGPTLPAARSNADELLGGIAMRFTNVQRTPRFTEARDKLGKYALTPSAIYTDSAVWTSIAPDNTRLLFIEGSFNNNRYLFAPKPAVPMPDKVGESRHFIQLKRFSSDEFEWFTSVDIGAGRIGADDFANVISRFMAAGENTHPNLLRAEYRTFFPRSTASLGRLFSLDSLRTVPDDEGATTIVLGIRLKPDSIKKSFPDFAAYLEKYVSPSRYRVQLTDSRGVKWFEIRGRDNLLQMRFRSKGGHFMPLEGGIRSIPDSLQIKVDFTTRILFFNVGVANMVGEFNNIDSDRERGWAMRFRKEPDWKLPPAVRFFIKSPLRRPFQGNGATFRISLRDNPGTQTILNHRSGVVVQESAILRFLGKLGATAMGDFIGESEAQENRFNAEVFTALRADVRALLQ